MSLSPRPQSPPAMNPCGRTGVDVPTHRDPGGPPPISECVFDYSPEFRNLIVQMHKGKEGLPNYPGYIRDHLGGENSRLNAFSRYLYPEIRLHCGDLASCRVLDFGCGTGASTAILAQHSREVVGFDISPQSVSICRRRLAEHGLLDRARVISARDFRSVLGDIGTFDLVLMEGVLEHVPITAGSLRGDLLRTLFGILNPEGHLFISGTPNRLWPFDFHSTQLWWIPWMRPGSKRAYLKAVRKGRIADNAGGSPRGPVFLEEEGAWGSTYFEIVRALPRGFFEVVNSRPGHNRHVSYSFRPLYRELFDFFAYVFVTSLTGLPPTALSPAIDNLAIQKRTRL